MTSRCCGLVSLDVVVRATATAGKRPSQISVPSFSSLQSTMAWRGSTIVLVALCLGLTVRADEYGEADGDATGASDAIGAL